VEKEDAAIAVSIIEADPDNRPTDITDSPPPRMSTARIDAEDPESRKPEADTALRKRAFAETEIE
jgi:hypothetical protein